MTYTVETVSTGDDDKIAVQSSGTFSNKIKAMQFAKRIASGSKDCVTYGPTSIAYVGREVTAVVSWK